VRLKTQLFVIGFMLTVAGLSSQIFYAHLFVCVGLGQVACAHFSVSKEMKRI